MKRRVNIWPNCIIALEQLLAKGPIIGISCPLRYPLAGLVLVRAYNKDHHSLYHPIRISLCKYPEPNILCWILPTSRSSNWAKQVQRIKDTIGNSSVPLLSGIFLPIFGCQPTRDGVRWRGWGGGKGGQTGSVLWRFTILWQLWCATRVVC